MENSSNPAYASQEDTSAIRSPYGFPVIVADTASVGTGQDEDDSANSTKAQDYYEEAALLAIRTHKKSVVIEDMLARIHGFQIPKKPVVEPFFDKTRSVSGGRDLPNYSL